MTGEITHTSVWTHFPAPDHFTGKDFSPDIWICPASPFKVALAHSPSDCLRELLQFDRPIRVALVAWRLSTFCERIPRVYSGMPLCISSGLVLYVQFQSPKRCC